MRRNCASGKRGWSRSLLEIESCLFSCLNLKRPKRWQGAAIILEDKRGGGKAITSPRDGEARFLVMEIACELAQISSICPRKTPAAAAH